MRTCDAMNQQRLLANGYVRPLHLLILLLTSDYDKWPDTLVSPYTSAVTCAVKAAGALKVIDTPTLALGNTAAIHFFDTLHDGLLSASAFLIEAARSLGSADVGAEGEAALRKSFKLGPQGVTPIISFLHSAHQFLVAHLESSGLSSINCQSFAKALRELEPLASALLRLLKAFRSTVSRVYWDPHGFCDLRLMMKDSDKYFEVSNFSTLIIQWV